MPFNLTSSILIKIGIFVFFLAWAVLITKARYASKLSWKKSVLVVVFTVLITCLVGGVVSILSIVFLQRWIDGEILETIVLIVSLIMMYVTFRYLQKHLEPRFTKSNLSNDN